MSLPRQGTIRWRVLAHLHHVREPRTVEAIARSTGLTGQQVGAALVGLESAGCVRPSEATSTNGCLAWLVSHRARAAINRLARGASAGVRRAMALEVVDG